MRSALEIHAIHEELQRLLVLHPAPAVALELERRFLDAALSMDGTVWIGYGFPVASSLAARIAGIPLSGLAPEELDALDEVIRRCRALPVPPWPDAARWEGTAERAAAALARARGELAGILRGAEPPGGDPADADAPEAAVRVPVVMGPLAPERVDPFFASVRAARLITLRVRADFVFRSPRRPELAIEGGASPEVHAAFQDAIRRVADLRVPGTPPLGRCLFRASWDDLLDARLAGRSASLPFLLASGAALAAASGGLWTRSIASGVAATGDLDGTSVRPVAAETLPLKVRACFFSPARVLCVPWEQRGDALAEARRLEARHPGRQLPIRGVRDAREVWIDPTVAPARRRSVRRAAALTLRRAAMGRASLVMAAAILVLTGGLAGREAVLSRNLPVSARWDGRAIVLRNAHGRICKRIEMDCEEPDLGPPADPQGAALAVLDLDADGKGDLLAIHGRAARDHDLLTAMDRDGRVLWRRSAAEVAPPGALVRSDLGWRGFYVSDPRGTGVTEILALRRSTQHGLTIIDRIHASSGRILGQLRNDGHLESMFRLDLDGDGRPEWIALGTDNASGRALLVVLDPDRMTAVQEGEDLTTLPCMVDPASLDLGLRAALTFAKDRYSTQERASCRFLSQAEGGAVIVTVSGEGNGAVLYYLAFDGAGRARLRTAQITDGYRAWIRGRFGDAEVERGVGVEEGRLAGEVRSLSRAGWIPLSATEGERSSEGGPDGM